MIMNRPLTAEEMKSGRLFYNLYCVVNGLSYNCMGETILILFALQLGCQDTVIALLGSMIFVGFLFLPLGKIMTSHTGAVRSQSDFWVLRNIAALMIVGAAPASAAGYNAAATGLLLTGALLFYGFRAAGVVMSQPLVGEICPPEMRGRFIALSWTFFYTTGFISLITISLLTKYHPGIKTLCFVIASGSVIGIISSCFLRIVKESGEIKKSAAQPIFKEYKKVFKAGVIRRQIYAGTVCYMGLILTMPISLLTIKKGFGATDTQALIFSLIQLCASIPASFIQSRISDKLGGKIMLLAAHCSLILTAIYWLIVPGNFSWFILPLPFLLVAYGNTGINNALPQYFLQTVSKELQVTASIFISIASGAVAGLLGACLSSILLKISVLLNKTSEALVTYRIYFAIVLLVLLASTYFIFRLRGKRN